jgi:nitrogen fixation NifU-like protein
MYTDIVVDHYRNPRNVGRLDAADGIGEAGAIECGDYLVIFIKVENNFIREISFEVYGCGAAIASSSMTTVLAKDKHVMAAYGITKKNIIEALGGLPREKEHCSILGEKALKNAIIDYSRKINQKKV